MDIFPFHSQPLMVAVPEVDPLSLPPWLHQLTHHSLLTESLGPICLLLVKLVSGVLSEKLVQEIGGMFQFNIVGENGGTWYLDLKSGHGKIYTENLGDDPNVVLTMGVQDMQQIFYGQTTAFDAYMQGSLKVDGDLRVAMSLEAIVKMLKEKPVLQGNGVYVV